MDPSLWWDYIVFGVIDNFIVILGGVLGISIEAALPERFKMGLLIPVICCGLSNAVSDFCGGIMAANFQLAIGTLIGCLIAFVFLPMMLYMKKQREKRKKEKE